MKEIVSASTDLKTDDAGLAKYILLTVDQGPGYFLNTFQLMYANIVNWRPVWTPS